MVISKVPTSTGLGIEIINPLAQIANTYNDYNLKKINGNWIGLQGFQDFTISSSIGFNTQTASRNRLPNTLFG
jgi:hypothetical protein